jgi:dihydrofolate reductase
MRKINVLEFVSLDGVIEAPGGPEKDTSGPPWWIRMHSDPVSSATVKKQMNMPFDLLLGRITFDLWSQFWPQHGDTPERLSDTRTTSYGSLNHKK